MNKNLKEELLEQKKAEKEQQLNVLSEIERTAILSHEKWVESKGADGCKIDLCGKDLSKVELTDINFDEADLKNANLSGTKIYRCSFKEACMSNCNLEGTRIDATLVRAKLNDIKGANADFSSDECDYAYFTGAILQKANFTEASLCHADFMFADLSEANFECADLSGTGFIRANLRNANLLGAKLMDANLYGADISGAKISLKDITIKQLEMCLFTPELAQMIYAKCNLMKIHEGEFL